MDPARWGACTGLNETGTAAFPNAPERNRMYNRRQILRSFGPALCLAGRLDAFSRESGKKLEGVFPIGFSPFTEDNRLDVEGLAAQVQFCNRGGVHGFVWPQLASAWTTLTEAERLAGAEAILAGGKGGRTALV